VKGVSDVGERNHDAARHIDRFGGMLSDAAERMRDSEVGVLPVFESGRLTGMLTDRDLVVRGMAEGKEPQTTTVREIMTPRAVYVFEDQNTSEAAQLMRDQRVRRLVVLNHNHDLVGIVSASGPARAGVHRRRRFLGGGESSREHLACRRRQGGALSLRRSLRAANCLSLTRFVSTRGDTAWPSWGITSRRGGNAPLHLRRAREQPALSPGVRLLRSQILPVGGQGR
jgi:hypothetical protein